MFLNVQAIGETNYRCDWDIDFVVWNFMYFTIFGCVYDNEITVKKNCILTKQLYLKIKN